MSQLRSIEPVRDRTTTRQHRVLVIAEAANPEWTSVPLIGWKLSRALSRVADVHLATHVRNRDAILRQGLLEGRDFTAIDNERIAAPLYQLAEKIRGGKGKGWTTSTAFSSLAYYSFESELWRQFGTRIAAREFDLVHRVTPLSPTSQSLIARRLSRLGIPFVIGPLNGGVPWPPNFKTRQYAEREWLSSVRWLYKCMPGYGSMRRLSARIIVGSKFTYEDMPDWAQGKCVYVPENGVDAESIARPGDRPTPSRPIRVAFVGRLVAYKGADLLLEAAKELTRNGDLELHIIGDGPERTSLEAMAERFAISHSVHFHGWLPHAATLEKLRKYDLLALPSVREFGGGVVIEAMALGVPPVVADYGGPSELVNEKTGIKVPFHDAASLVEGLKNAFVSVLASPGILTSLGEAARGHALEFLTWDAKANQIVSVYDEATGVFGSR